MKEKKSHKKIEWSLLAYRYTPSKFDMRYEHIIQNHRPAPSPYQPPTHRTYNNNENPLRGGIFARDFSRRLRFFEKGILRERDFARDFARRLWLFSNVRYDLLTFNGFEEWINWLILQIRWIKIDLFESSDWSNSLKRR